MSADEEKTNEKLKVFASQVKERHKLLGLILDAHKRMATNREQNYRITQQIKIDEWQEELTKLFENNPLIFSVP